jgi:hypothetical protein
MPAHAHPITLGVLVGKLRPYRPLEVQQAFAQELIEEGQRRGVTVYLFTRSHVADDYTSIRGITYEDGWVVRDFGPPTVVYNRLLARHAEQHPTTKKLFALFQRLHGTRIFNSTYLDKHEVFAQIARSRAVAGHVPETVTVRSLAQLEAMCARHASVFVKPSRGSLGRGILRVTRLADGHYRLDRTARGDVTLSQTYGSLSACMQAIRPIVARATYIAQRGIALLHDRGRPVDFRTLVYASGPRRSWQAISAVARIGAADQFVSNAARGGKVLSAAPYLRKTHRYLPRDTYRRLRHTAARIAQATASAAPGLYLELGIDLAIDRAGHIWLLEVNAKPAKQHLVATAVSRTRPSVRHLIQAVRMLAKEVNP